MDAKFLSLIGACIAGDGPAWEAFSREYGSVAIQFLSYRYSSLTTDEHYDILQNVFVKLAHGGLGSFKGATEYEFISYFKRITKNEAFTWLKQRKRREQEISIDQENDPEDDDAPSPPILADNSLRPDKTIEIKNLLEKSLSGLSMEEKRILIYKLEEYKDKEIADIMGIPMGTVASRYNRMKLALKNLLTSIFLLIFLGRK
jgi:RNA polymerase sigma-70 factor (ECF subfamily)